jgi:1,2-diacylglycerol 3-beta-galactosyltransferase
MREILDEVDMFRKVTGLSLEDIYNTLLKNGWTLGSTQMLPFMHFAIRMFHGKQVELMRRYWAVTQPDMVVSLVPNFNRALKQGMERANPKVPYVTILTDLADFPPHFWLERQKQYVICGTEKAALQAREFEIPEERIFRTSGMILHPRYYEPVTTDRAEQRRRLGLDPERTTGLVLFGGHGSNAMFDIAKRLDRTGIPLQLILICGHNKNLAERLRALKTNIPMFVEEFTQDIPQYMHISDFMIGKPGPGSISEALAMHLPVIVERNAWTLPQERYNADWATEQEVGLVLPSMNRIAEGVAELLQPEKFQRFRQNAAAIRNRAVFEIPDILKQILQSHS